METHHAHNVNTKVNFVLEHNILSTGKTQFLVTLLERQFAAL